MSKGIVKERADILLVKRGLAENRSQARSKIMSGQVLQNDVPISKSGDMLSVDVILRLKGLKVGEVRSDWASRGGIKLSGALEHWSIDVRGRLCADVGSSTGGFCDVLLRGGASGVYAIDVGRGQLHERLRQDERIISLEGCNVRYITAEQLPIFPSFISCDVSFISLQKALGSILSLCRNHGEETILVALIKPQFQLAKKHIVKGGVVKDEILHQQACDEVKDWLQGEGCQIMGIKESSITGMTGNREFFIYAVLKKGSGEASGEASGEGSGSS